MDRITFVCFGASYLVAMLMYCYAQRYFNTKLRMGALGFHTAGSIAHTLYLSYHQPALFSPPGFFHFFSWLVSLGALNWEISKGRSASLFALPVVVVLITLAWVFGTLGQEGGILLRDSKGWGLVHAATLILSSLAMGYGCVTASMYLARSQQLLAKHRPGTGLQLHSLEHLESLVRQSLVIAFPLLSGGVLIGAGMLWNEAANLDGWCDPRVVGSLVLWADFAFLVILRYWMHVRGRWLAMLTIASFVLLLACAALPHTLPGRPPKPMEGTP